MNLEENYSFKIDAIPPYNFELTIRKPAGWWWSSIDEEFKNDTCWTATRFKGELLGLKLRSTGDTDKPQLHCKIYSQAKMTASAKQLIKHMLKRALKTEEDLTPFYNLSRKDNILRDAVLDLYGMHTVGWPELFPALILAVTLQMAPMKRSNQMMELLTAKYGDQVDFDGKSIRYWPSVQTIASKSPQELKVEAKLGYRAQNLISIAKTLIQGFPTMDKLSAMEPEEAKKELLTLRGIGDYSAELVMPQMGFPLDIWSAKIFHVLFYGKEPQNPRETIPDLKKIAQQRWGKWRGYAFVYVLNDLAKLSEKVGTDLTKF